MNPGDMVLFRMPQVAGTPKLRPALVLAPLPGHYQTLLLCGITTQMRNIQSNWDEPILTSDADFGASGLHQASLIRLSYLYAAEPGEVAGVIGKIDGARLDRLRTRLADRIRP